MLGSDVLMWESTTMVPFTPSSSPASFARCVSGVTPSATTAISVSMTSPSLRTARSGPSVSNDASASDRISLTPLALRQ